MEPVEGGSASGDDASKTFPLGGVSGMSIQKETLGRTKDTLKRLYLSAGLGMSLCPPGGFVDGERSVWISLYFEQVRLFFASISFIASWGKKTEEYCPTWKRGKINLDMSINLIKNKSYNNDKLYMMNLGKAVSGLEVSMTNTSSVKYSLLKLHYILYSSESNKEVSCFKSLHIHIQIKYNTAVCFSFYHRTQFAQCQTLNIWCSCLHFQSNY